MNSPFNLKIRNLSSSDIDFSFSQFFYCFFTTELTAMTGMKSSSTLWERTILRPIWKPIMINIVLLITNWQQLIIPLQKKAASRTSGRRKKFIPQILWQRLRHKVFFFLKRVRNRPYNLYCNKNYAFILIYVYFKINKCVRTHYNLEFCFTRTW